MNILEATEKVCLHLSSNPANEWVDTAKIATLIKRSSSTDEEVELAMQFLKNYFLELNGNKARLAKCAHEIFKE